MTLSDFHIHSSCSDDALDTMTDMASAVQKKGVSIVCFTDHCDIDTFKTGVYDPDCFNNVWPGIKKQYADAISRLGSSMDIRLRLELGEINHAPALAEEIAAQPELDFILGSLHNLKDTPDFYSLRYESAEHCAALTHRYLDELYDLAGLSSFDCVSHIGYARRYMLRAGFDVDLSEARFADQVERLLKRVIENGRGIEINCSGYRNSLLRRSIPDGRILRRYRELGGEIITIGSDAHCVADAGAGLQKGADLLRELGFRYFAVYKKRKAELIPLD